jgi:hypothetical protein
VTETVKPDKILHGLNLSHTHVQPTAVCNVNMLSVKELILEKRQITVHDIASISGISVGSVETITHGYLLFKTVCPVGPKGVNV